MEVEHGMVLPRRLQIEFSSAIQHVTEDTGTEISPDAMWEVFSTEYLAPGEIRILSIESASSADHDKVTAQLLVGEKTVTFTAEGNGPISAFVRGCNEALGTNIDVVDYSEHAIASGAGARAAAYVETTDPDGHTRWGVGIDASILNASVQAVVSALNARNRLASSA
jgi:2-isopropylmalate synthase